MDDITERIKKRLQELIVEIQISADRKQLLEQEMTSLDVRINQLAGAIHELKALIGQEKADENS